MAEAMNERIAEATKKIGELNAVLSSMNDGVLAVDQDEVVHILNTAASSLLDISESDVASKRIYESTRNVQLLDFVELSLRTDAVLERDIEETKNNQILHLTSSPLKDGDNKMLGTIIIVSNVTQSRNIDAMRRDFGASVSHEIKTP